MKLTRRTDRRERRKRRREIAEVSRGDLPRIERLEADVRRLTVERDEAIAARAELVSWAERADAARRGELDRSRALLVGARERAEYLSNVVAAQVRDAAALTGRIAELEDLLADTRAREVANADAVAEVRRLRARLERKHRDAAKAPANRRALGFVRGGP